MQPLQLTLVAGARDSQLSQIQTQDALRRLRLAFPGLEFDFRPMSSPGDLDQSTDLRDSAPDFFTRFLDDALRRGDLDLALHSAKDLPEPFPEDLDWFWLPWPADPRDVLVCRAGRSLAELPPQPVIGVSSGRREAYCRRRFPGAQLRSIRGTIERRLEQLDEGRYDLLLMAGAALERLQLGHRISEWLSLAELPPPPGQGYLAVTFRRGDPRLQCLRRLFLQPLLCLGTAAMPDDLGEAGLAAWRACGVCLAAGSLPAALRAELPPAADLRELTAPGTEAGRLAALLCRQGQAVAWWSAGAAGAPPGFPTDLPWRAAPAGAGDHLAPAALGGQAVLLTCTRELLPRALAATMALGGVPRPLPLVDTVLDRTVLPELARLPQYDWLVLTSPTAARLWWQALGELPAPPSPLPPILACGPGVDRVLAAAGLKAAACPATEFGADSLASVARERLWPGAKVLRLRSDLAGPALAESLRQQGAAVTDRVLYQTRAAPPAPLPEFAAVFFASASAAAVFVSRWGVAGLAGKCVLALGEPTAAALRRLGRAPDLVSPVADVAAALAYLAATGLLTAAAALAGARQADYIADIRFRDPGAPRGAP